jgi:hypothetical protein
MLGAMNESVRETWAEAGAKKSPKAGKGRPRTKSPAKKPPGRKKKKDK